MSSDRDLASFKSYAGHFPFPSIPFEDRPIRQKLSSLFGITGIPCLVVADPQGNLITKAGREGVSTDPENFPWRPRSLAEVIEGPLVRADHSVLPSAGAHIKGKKVALYFSASWCGPCKKFSPILKECYAATRDRGFEVIFVSADHDEPSFAAYFGEMPWTAIPFGDPRIEALNSHFEVEGIPTTIFLDGDSLRVLHKELRPFVMSDSKGVNFPWRPVAVSELSQAFLGNINDVACALIFLPAGKKFAEFENVAKETAARILAEAEASGKDAAIRFAIAEHENGLADSIRGFLNQNAQSEPELVLLDIPAAKKYVFRNVPITGESIAKVAGEYLAGNLAGAKGIKDGDFVPKAAPGGGHGHSHGGAECHGVRIFLPMFGEN